MANAMLYCMCELQMYVLQCINVVYLCMHYKKQ